MTLHVNCPGRDEAAEAGNVLAIARLNKSKNTRKTENPQPVAEVVPAGWCYFLHVHYPGGGLEHRGRFSCRNAALSAAHILNMQFASEAAA